MRLPRKEDIAQEGIRKVASIDGWDAIKNKCFNKGVCKRRDRRGRHTRQIKRGVHHRRLRPAENYTETLTGHRKGRTDTCLLRTTILVRSAAPDRTVGESSHNIRSRYCQVYRSPRVSGGMEHAPGAHSLQPKKPIK